MIVFFMFAFGFYDGIVLPKMHTKLMQMAKSIR